MLFVTRETRVNSPDTGCWTVPSWDPNEPSEQNEQKGGRRGSGGVLWWSHNGKVTALIPKEAETRLPLDTSALFELVLLPLLFTSLPVGKTSENMTNGTETLLSFTVTSVQFLCRTRTHILEKHEQTCSHYENIKHKNVFLLIKIKWLITYRKYYN